MKLSNNFDVREFVPKSTFDHWGEKSRWFVNRVLVDIAEFYKLFFTDYFKKKYPGKVKSVSIVINNWHYGGVKQYSGYRPPEYTEGAKESQHRHHNAFDCEIKINFLDDTSIEADYVEIHSVIQKHEQTFMANGVTTLEDVSIAKGWLHTDARWTGMSKILIVKP